MVVCFLAIAAATPVPEPHQGAVIAGPAVTYSAYAGAPVAYSSGYVASPYNAYAAPVVRSYASPVSYSAYSAYPGFSYY